ncbi:MAG TPA: hypothetical protein ENJ49_01235 [Candidatus Moranbacteria bacterium]|nr:hypothetical protein [Candidatus Moranbacteria bacterium]
MKKYAYFNGKVVLEKDVRIDFNDLGFVRGYGVFEAIKTVNRKPFLLKEHFERLQKSAIELNLKLDMGWREFSETINDLLWKNQIEKDVAIKVVLTGGVSSNGLKMDGVPTFLITLKDLSVVTPAEELYQTGVGIILTEFQRYLPEIKTLNYITAIQNQKRKETENALEIVYHWEGFLLEGATGNIFIVKNNRVITPKEDILPGTVRNFVIELLRENGTTVEMRKVKLSELFEADEVFLTGTFKNILPVTEIEGEKAAGGRVGKKTKEIMKLFKNESKKVV